MTKANILYQKGKAAAEQLKEEKKPQGLLTGKIIRALDRAGYKNGQEELDVFQIKADIENGKIWAVRDLGPTSIRKICRWVIEQEEKLTDAP